ncbi:MAG TPA: hypothetical protein PL160_05780, partial [Candidatus Cloacimonas sp.]|nr:hypothetical protein [Candidatus Cloacimonas sp.]
MTDFEDKVKDRWKERRKKAYNWPKILIMLFVLVAIFYAMNRLGDTKNVVVNPSSSVVDTLRDDSTSAEVEP